LKMQVISIFYKREPNDIEIEQSFFSVAGYNAPSANYAGPIYNYQVQKSHVTSA